MIQVSTLTRNLHDVEEVGSDFILLTDNRANVNITFADEKPKLEGKLPPTEKKGIGSGFSEESFIRFILRFRLCHSAARPRDLNAFLDHHIRIRMMRSISVFEYGRQHRNQPVSAREAQIQIELLPEVVYGNGLKT
jgi:hypothetical protein